MVSQKQRRSHGHSIGPRGIATGLVARCAGIRDGAQRLLHQTLPSLTSGSWDLCDRAGVLGSERRRDSFFSLDVRLGRKLWHDAIQQMLSLGHPFQEREGDSEAPLRLPTVEMPSRKGPSSEGTRISPAKRGPRKLGRSAAQIVLVRKPGAYHFVPYILSPASPRPGMM